LGLSDQSAFTKAFRCWSRQAAGGVAPPTPPRGCVSATLGSPRVSGRPWRALDPRRRDGGAAWDHPHSPV